MATPTFEPTLKILKIGPLKVRPKFDNVQTKHHTEKCLEQNLQEISLTIRWVGQGQIIFKIEIPIFAPERLRQD